MTGSLQGGQRIAIRQYNAIRNHLEEIGAIPEDLFQELDEDESSFDELGVVTGMLDGYLEEDIAAKEESEIEREIELERPERAGRRKRHFGMMLGNLSELQELRELGAFIRENLPGLVKAYGKGKAGKGAGWDIKVEVETEDEEEREEAGPSRQQEIIAEMEATAERLKREDIDARERAELGQRIAQLGRELAEALRQAPKF